MYDLFMDDICCNQGNHANDSISVQIDTWQNQIDYILMKLGKKFDFTHVAKISSNQQNRNEMTPRGQSSIDYSS